MATNKRGPIALVSSLGIFPWLTFIIWNQILASYILNYSYLIQTCNLNVSLANDKPNIKIQTIGFVWKIFCLYERSIRIKRMTKLYNGFHSVPSLFRGIRIYLSIGESLPKIKQRFETIDSIKAVTVRANNIWVTVRFE